jgi:hypothetical protein
MSDDQISGMRLPPKLIAALGDGTWSAQGKHWNAVFPEGEVLMPSLYSQDLMRRENESWRGETEPVYVGAADGRFVPGDLDPTRSVLIGDLQPDAMIALDYRSRADAPSVAYLNLDGRWVVVAQTFDDFWRRLVDGA